MPPINRLTARKSWFDVRDYGAVGDGVTSDHVAFQQARLKAIAAGGGVVYAPPTPNGYVIGDGSTVGTALYGGDGLIYRGDETLLIHRARNAANQSRLFTIQDCVGCVVDGFLIDGEENVRVAVSLEGIVERARLLNLHAFDCANFAIQYANKSGDDGTDPDTARLIDALLQNIRIDGIVGPTGDGSGIDLFPRALDSDGLPASRKVTIRDFYIDVTQTVGGDPTLTSDHGPQGVKVNNIKDFLVESGSVRGGDVAAVTLTNGCQDGVARNIWTEASRTGLNLSGSPHTDTPATVSRNLKAEGLTYRKGIAVIANPIGLRFHGDIDGVSARDVDCPEAIISIEHDTTAGAANLLRNLSLSNWVARAIEMEDPATSVPNVDGVAISDGELRGGRMRLGATANRGIKDGKIERVKVIEYDGAYPVTVAGSKIRVAKVHAYHCNESAAASSAAVQGNFADDLEVDTIHVENSGTGGLLHFFRAAQAGRAIRWRQLQGAVLATDGRQWHLASHTSESRCIAVPDYCAGPFDLSGAADYRTLFIAPADGVISHLLYHYTEASSADAGVAIRVKRNGSNVLNQVSHVSQAINTTVERVNSTDYNHVTFTKGQRIEVGTDGGKTGAGAVIVQVNVTYFAG